MDSETTQQAQLQPYALQSKQQQQASSVLKRPREQSLSGAASAEMDPFTAAAAAAGDAMDEDSLQQQHGLSASAAGLPPLPPHKAAGGSGGGGGAARQAPQQQQQADAAAVVLPEPQSSFRVTPSGQHYYELDDPAAALAALEHDMAALMTEVVAEVGSSGSLLVAALAAELVWCVVPASRQRRAVNIQQGPALRCPPKSCRLLVLLCAQCRRRAHQAARLPRWVCLQLAYVVPSLGNQCSLGTQ